MDIGQSVRQIITDDTLRAIAEDFGVVQNEAFR